MQTQSLSSTLLFPVTASEDSEKKSLSFQTQFPFAKYKILLYLHYILEDFNYAMKEVDYCNALAFINSQMNHKWNLHSEVVVVVVVTSASCIFEIVI